MTDIIPPLTIAIDGPAAAGKGTLARRLAAHYGLAFLDTGALYRATGLTLLRAGADPTDERKAEAAARTLDPAILSDPALRDEASGQAASAVAKIPAVRARSARLPADLRRRSAGRQKGRGARRTRYWDHCLPQGTKPSCS